MERAGFVLQAYHPFALKAFPGIRENREWANIWQILAGMEDLSVIHLRRENLLERHLSHVMARSTGQWHDWDKQRVKSVTHLEPGADVPSSGNVERKQTVTLDPQQLETDFAEVQGWHVRAEQILADHRNVSITYEELCADFTGVGGLLLDFLELPSYSLEAAVKKLEKRGMREAISNFDVLQEYFMDTPWSGFFEL